MVVNAADSLTGDLVPLEAGDRISADLELAEAHEPAVNESMPTGESVPRRPREKAAVFAGTFVAGQAACGPIPSRPTDEAGHTGPYRKAEGPYEERTFRPAGEARHRRTMEQR